MAGNARSPFEIDEVVLLSEFDVVEHGEAELPHFDFAAANFPTPGFVADGHFGVRQVGHAAVNDSRLRYDPSPLRLLGLLLLAKLPTFLFALFSLGIVLGLANRFADDIRLAGQVLDFLLQLPTLDFQLHVASHVGRHAPIVAILLHQQGVLQNESFVEHLRLFTFS